MSLNAAALHGQDWHGARATLDHDRCAAMQDECRADIEEQFRGAKAAQDRENRDRVRVMIGSLEEDLKRRTQSSDARIALGQPAAQAIDNSLTQLFRKLGGAAWAVANGAGQVTEQTCSAALREADIAAADEDLEVVAVPEIAAQVYGFVTSSRFDPNARNLYLLADVGAGTVDACLFQVRRASGRWSFDIYTAAVEPTGVINLHRNRVAWWQSHLSRHVGGGALAREFEAIRFDTDHQANVPPSYLDYVTGVTVELSGKELDPDHAFFENRLLTQVRGRALYRAFRERLLAEHDLTGVPFFLCGGGSRHALYARLPQELRERPSGFTWLGATHRELELPSELRADGVARADYDRLSVAYGLSMLDVAAINTVRTTLPKLAPEQDGRWRDTYVSKDTC